MAPRRPRLNRRQFLRKTLRFGGGLLAGATLPGCERQSDESRTEHRGDETAYHVSLSPVGTVRFHDVPERVVAHDANYADMMIALGVIDRLVALGWPERFQKRYVSRLYRQLPGLNVDTSQVASIQEGRSLDKELLYALDADLHHIDPLQLSSFPGWSERDVDEIRKNVAPFFANRFSRAHRYDGPHRYQYYGIWELHEKMAAVYRRPEKAQDLRALGKQLENRIKKDRPDHRPKALLINYQDEVFWVRRNLNGPGISRQHLRKLGLQDAMVDGSDADPLGKEGKTDLEGILALQPDVLLEQWSLTKTNPRLKSLRDLRDHPLARKISAFAHDRLYAGGTPLQGPLTYLFQLEMVAKQVYPEVFGPWRGHGNLPEDEWLFDRRKVADIILCEN